MNFPLEFKPVTHAYKTAEPVKPLKRKYPKIGRNDMCPCGSNLKYKKCCIDKRGV